MELKAGLELKLGDKYRLIKKAGSGAFGVIYKGKPTLLSNSCVGTNLKTGEEVAIKFVILFTYFVIRNLLKRSIPNSIMKLSSIRYSMVNVTS